MAHYGPSIFEGTAEDYLKQVFEQHARRMPPRIS